MPGMLHEHILHLENLIQTLTDQLTAPRRKPSEHDLVNDEIRSAEISLQHYRTAFEREQAPISAGSR